MSAGRRDRGFTLVELIVVIALMSVVSLSVGAALFLGIRTASNTYTRFDQSNAAFSINRYLTPDIYAAEGAVIVNDASDTTCGGVAPLKMWSRSQAAIVAPDTVVVWLLSGTDLVRRVCVNGVATSTRVVATGMAVFTPAPCAAPCSDRAITVQFGAKGKGLVDPQSWSLTVTRRGATA